MAKATKAKGANPSPKRGSAPKAATSSSNPPVRSAPDLDGLTALQRRAGNRAVAALIESLPATLQRVPVNAQFHETLYNDENAAGQAIARPGGFTGGTPTSVANPQNASYDMARNADGSGVTILIKVRFLQQNRNTTPPPPTGAPNPTNIPRLGALVGSPTEIPTSDPSDRRTWAADTANKATTLWNSRKISFVSQDTPQPGEGAGSRAAPLPPTPVRLPVTFKAQAVFGLNEAAHQQVIVHPPASVPGTAGHPIDAGNWYRQDNDPAKRSASYPHTDDVIYAHEYGHMLGIPDEYSQSNAQMNALMHQAAPKTAASSKAALDKTTIERMALAALTPALSSQLSSALPAMTGALNAKRVPVTRKLAAAARAGVLTPDVRTELETQLTAGSEARVAPGIPRVVAFQTTRNFSNAGIADQAVKGAFAVAALRTLIGDAYDAALAAPHSVNVAVTDFDKVSINVSSGVSNAAAPGTAIAGAATTEAAKVVGPTPAGPGLPPVAVPPASLVGQLSALPATWSAAGSQLETSVTPAAFSTAMTAGLKGTAAAAAAAAAIPGYVPPAKAGTAAALYRKGFSLVNKAAQATAKQLVNDLLLATVKPTLTASVTALQSSISAEVTRITTTPPAGVAVAGPADPQMAAIVGAMKTRLDADKTATAGTGRDPTAGGGSAPAQNVTYTAQGLMGGMSDNSVRTDQFQKMVDAFNAKLRKVPREDPFKVEVGK